MILDDFKLGGKCAVVTGASRGLGKAMALGLAEAGADIALVATDRDALERAAEELAPTGVQTLVHPADLREPCQIDEMVAAVHERFGHIDVLLNNAGVINRAPAVDYTAEMWDDVMSINIRGAFFCAQAVGRVMIQQGGGKIINIASLLSGIGVPFIPAYTASKGGIAQLTKSLAVEWAQHNINVNAIAPGYFRTDNTAALQNDQERNAYIVKRVPFHRWGEPEELRGAVVFLASRASDYMTGQVIFVDGGWTAT